MFAAFLLFTKVVKMASHFKQHPGDIVWLPALIAFAYLHGFLNLYAVATMTTTVWGGKKVDQKMCRFGFLDAFKYRDRDV